MKHSIYAALMGLLLIGLLGCQQPHKVQVPLPNITVGLTGAVQPMGTTDLLAGFIEEDRSLATPEALLTFDENMLRIVRESSTRQVDPIPAGPGVDPSARRAAGYNSALEYWVSVGKQAGVELLIVPQILNWEERQGSAAGVVSSAAIDVNYYLINIKENSLIQRSHFEEKQLPLASNLLDIGTFLKRGGKWLTAQELADESVQKMIEEFGL